MSRVSACATRPAAAATMTARKLMKTTRMSTSDLSGGTRAASRVGASEGATGRASVVAPVITSSTGICAPYSAPRNKGTLFRDQSFRLWSVGRSGLRLRRAEAEGRSIGGTRAGALPQFRRRLHALRHACPALARVALLGEEDRSRRTSHREELEQRFLTGAALAALARDQLLDGFEVVREDLAVVRGAQDRRPDVRRLAHGGGVSEMRGGFLHRGAEHLAAIGHAGNDLGAHPREDVRADHRSRPGTEVLGGEAISHRLLDEVVDVVSMHVHHVASFVSELEQLPPRQLHQFADDARNLPIAKRAPLLLARFACVVEVDDVAADLHVPFAKRGDSEGAVLLGVDVAARAHEAGGEDSQDARHHLLAREARKAERRIDARAHPRQRPREGHEPVVLLLLALADRLIPVAVLPAARLVLADRLYLRAGRAPHRHVRPGGRDGERLEPLQVVPRSAPPAEAPFWGS